MTCWSTAILLALGGNAPALRAAQQRLNSKGNIAPSEMNLLGRAYGGLMASRSRIQPRRRSGWLTPHARAFVFVWPAGLLAMSTYTCLPVWRRSRRGYL